MLDLSFEPSLDVVSQGFHNLGSSLRSFRTPLERAVREVAVPSIAENFAVGGRPQWEPNAPGTIAIKGNDNVLINSGALQRGATQLNLWSYDSESARVSSLPDRAWYGIVHQQGGPPGRAGHIPERPFMLLQDEDLDKLQDVFADWLGEKLDAL